MIKKYIQGLIAEWKQIISFFKKAYTVLVFRYIKWKANELSENYGCQIFVIKCRGRAKMITKEQFKSMRQRGIFPKNFTALELKKICLYYTSNKQINK